MTRDLSPLRLLLVTLAGWVNRRQQEVINYLVEENRVLQEQLGGRRVRLTDDQRRRLAARGQRLGRRLLRPVDGFLAGHRVLICDQDGKWTDRFRGLLEGAGVRVVLTPYQAPNANAHTERFVRSVREECLDRLILFGERHLIRALNEFTAHYHTERNHQGLDNRLIGPASGRLIGTHIRCHERLGGLLRYYHRAA
jgi:putative transposase